MAVAESIWKVSSNASNLNHIIVAIHGFNQFTFNVSMVLLTVALGGLTVKKKTNKMRLTNSQKAYQEILKLDYLNDANSKRIFFDFLTLFQNLQRLVCLSAARDESLKEIMVFEKKYLDQLESYLKLATENLTKIIRDQKDLNENTAVRFSQFVIFSKFNFRIIFM